MISRLSSVLLALVASLALGSSVRGQNSALQISELARIETWGRFFGNYVGLHSDHLFTTDGYRILAYDLRQLPSVPPPVLWGSGPAGSAGLLIKRDDLLVVRAWEGMFFQLFQVRPDGSLSHIFASSYVGWEDGAEGVTAVSYDGCCASYMQIFRRGDTGNYASDGIFTNMGRVTTVLDEDHVVVERQILPQSPEIRLWERSSNGWAPVPGEFQMSPDGKLPYAGRFHTMFLFGSYAPELLIYRYDNGWIGPFDLPTPSDLGGYDLGGLLFEGAVAESGDLLAIGMGNARAPGSQTTDGLVLLYRRLASGDFSYLGKIVNPSPTPNPPGGPVIHDGFGSSIDWQGRRLAVGNGNQSYSYRRIHVFEVMVDCDQDGLHDFEAIMEGIVSDANEDLVPDVCQDPDFDGDGVANRADNCPMFPNPRQSDCDGDGLGDECDQFSDCDRNSLDDLCEISDNTDLDCNGNQVLDACEISDNPRGLDCNDNGVPDSCDILAGAATDYDSNGLPDTCECLADLFSDGQVNGVDLAVVLSQWGAGKGAISDINRDDYVNAIDLAIILSSWGSCP